MALVELCKLDSKVNIRPHQRDEESTEATHLDMNFINPQQLALPPVGNVSISLILDTPRPNLYTYIDDYFVLHAACRFP